MIIFRTLAPNGTDGQRGQLHFPACPHLSLFAAGGLLTGWDEEMSLPDASEANADEVGVEGWAPGMTFGEFTGRVLRRNYGGLV